MNHMISKKTKYILMPDSFKGTMDALTVCNIMQDAILEYDSDADIICVPVADGGEGTVDCFLKAFGGKKKYRDVRGPYGDKKSAYYGVIDDCAIIELATVAGFSSDDRCHANPAKASTYGVGELIKDAVRDGMKKIIIGLGGSCSNDGGAGIAAALGTKFYDKNNNLFVPTGESLCNIVKIDNSETEKVLKDVDVQVMCDIDNPLYGPSGAAFVFAPQKGADMDMVVEMDKNLQYMSKKIKEYLGMDVSSIPGGGAAGGAGAGAYAYLGADLKQGINVILDLLDFENTIGDDTVIFTGEGQFDSQSLGGKVVVGISRRAKAVNVPVIAVVGRIKESDIDTTALGITKIYQTDPGNYETQADLKNHCRRDLKKTMCEIMQTILTPSAVCTTSS